uniref:iron donor protein CyaY n=1 Tax=Ningiella ruwaisensis TaxID=2364274 RepID=UPI00109F3F45|nr:iron donor protein CyaY [Ningiella ruwaisensis]
MKDAVYHQLVDDLLLQIEESLDDLDIDVDYESAEGILTIILPDQSKIILNKQPPLHQLWVATKFNGHHFNYTDGTWIDERTGAEFYRFLDEAMSRQAGTQVELKLQQN